LGRFPPPGARYPRGGDAVPCLRQPRPEHTINRGEATPWAAGTMCKGPVAKPNDLQIQCRVRTNEEPKRVEHRNDVGHDEPSLFGTASSLSRHKRYPVFVGTRALKKPGHRGSLDCRADFARASTRNAHTERFVRSVKEECLNRLAPFGEWHLRRTLREFVTHYHGERNHQGLANELIDGPATQRPMGAVCRRHRVGEILSYYYRSAA
jgi:hypothetical protein